jgi:hypothetical protein
MTLFLLLALILSALDCPLGADWCGPDTISPAAVWLPVVMR